MAKAPTKKKFDPATQFAKKGSSAKPAAKAKAADKPLSASAKARAKAAEASAARKVKIATAAQAVATTKKALDAARVAFAKARKRPTKRS